MVWLAVALALVVGLGAGLWLAWSWGAVGARPLPEPVASLQAHLRAQGVDASGSDVQRGAWRGVVQRFRFTVKGASDRRFYVLLCESPAVAEGIAASLRTAPQPAHPQANGSLALYTTEWPADDALGAKLAAAFASFRAPVAPR